MMGGGQRHYVIVRIGNGVMIACDTRRAELAGTVRLELGPPGRIPLKFSTRAMISTQIQIRFSILPLPWTIIVKSDAQGSDLLVNRAQRW